MEEDLLQLSWIKARMSGGGGIGFKVLANQLIKQIAVKQNSVPPLASIVLFSKKGPYRTENPFRSRKPVARKGLASLPPVLKLSAEALREGASLVW